MKSAIVIGATGLIGGSLTSQLLSDERYDKVKIFVRRPSGIINDKLEEHIVDFNLMEEWKDKITGDDLFSALGTTIKQAGSKEVQYTIDFTYQFEFAEYAVRNGVKNYLLVSSSGANAESNNFYLRIKGELEEKISRLPFDSINIFQPSLLVGDRDQKRAGENLAAPVLKFITKVVFKKYRPIEGFIVAKAMINASNRPSYKTSNLYTLDEIFTAAE